MDKTALRAKVDELHWAALDEKPSVKRKVFEAALTQAYEQGRLDGYHIGWIESRDAYLEELERIRESVTKPKPTTP